MSFFSPLNPPLRDWHGKTVWIVGASSGIGQATAAALHAQGANVVVSARKAADLDACTLKGLKQSGFNSFLTIKLNNTIYLENL